MLLTRSAIQVAYIIKITFTMNFLEEDDLAEYDLENLGIIEEDFITRLFTSPITVHLPDKKEKQLRKVSEREQDQVFELGLVTTILIQKDIRVENSNIHHNPSACLQASVNNSHLDKKKNTHQGELQHDIMKINMARRLTLQQKIQNLLNSQHNNLYLIKSMIYDVFNYLFVWQGYLHQMSVKHPSSLSTDISANLLRLIYHGQIFQLKKQCQKDKQQIIRKIIRPRYSKYSCQSLIDDCMKASECTSEKQRKQFYEGWVKQRISTIKEAPLSDVKSILMYINQEEYFDDIYK